MTLSCPHDLFLYRVNNAILTLMLSNGIMKTATLVANNFGNSQINKSGLQASKLCDVLCFINLGRRLLVPIQINIHYKFYTLSCCEANKVTI